MFELLHEGPQDQHQALQMVRLMIQFNLHPTAGLHVSWLPKDWPPPYRNLSRFGSAGHALLGCNLQLQHEVVNKIDFNFDSRLKRLALIDGMSLRKIAFYCGFAVHQSLLWARGGVGAQMRRQFRRVDQSKDAMEFLGKRIPPLDAFNMEMKPFEQRPLHAGHVVLTRGYRLLLALIALEGQATLLRIQRKLPHRISTLAVPTLNQQQARQLSELVLSCIVTERFSQWDWLF